MARIRPFAGVHYARHARDLSHLIAPPYDVLDERQKAALQAKDPHNIVTVDLPFLPPKSVGPDAVYAQANATLQAWLAAGVLEREASPAFYAYSQSFRHGGRAYRRRGFVALVRLSAFAEGEVVPHERTYAGPIEDRLKLMQHTHMQLSPIFGLFSDPGREVTELLYGESAGEPHFTGTLEGVEHAMWCVTDPELERRVVELMQPRSVYIADGHHRYTTALAYREAVERAHGAPLADAHAANWCMFVLVALQDEGLLILPTHRLIGGLSGFDVASLREALKDDFDLQDSATPDAAALAEEIARAGTPAYGLYEAASGKRYVLRLRNHDLLRVLEPDRSPAWRSLDVAILQRYLLDEVLQPRFGGGRELTRGYTADAGAIPYEVDGQKYQIALLLRPTPLEALETLGRHGEVMPQKSTYFYPKVATGMVLNPLR